MIVSESALLISSGISILCTQPLIETTYVAYTYCVCWLYISSVNVLKFQIDVCVRLVLSKVLAAACVQGSECYSQCI